MTAPLYEIQKIIISDDPLWKGIFLGTGVGKTRACLHLADGPTLVVALKQGRDDETWQKNRDEFGIDVDLTVISKEDFRRDWKILPYFKTLIFDECHTVLGVTANTFQKNYVKYPKTSQLFEAAHGYIKKHRPERLYLASATPVSKPMNMWAIATLLGEKWDWFKFRDKYYYEYQKGRFIPKKGAALKDRIAELVKKFGYTGRLQDFTDVPEQTHIVKHFELTPAQKKAVADAYASEADPLVRRAKIRTIENGVLYGKEIEMVTNRVEKLVDKVHIFPSEKLNYILERAEEFPKMLIFATYTAQIRTIEAELRQAGFKVLTLTGATKNRKQLLEDAEASKQCIVIAQSSISAGYELPSFPCVVYASKSYRYLDYEQSLGRVLRANALKKNLYIHLVVRGDADEACHNTIMEGKDFQEKIMSQEDPGY